MEAVHISYLITHNFLIRPPIFIKFISKCLILKAHEFEVHINLGYQNTLRSTLVKVTKAFDSMFYGKKISRIAFTKQIYRCINFSESKQYDFNML